MTLGLISAPTPPKLVAADTVDALARAPGPRAALFLDVDGTLLELAPTPDAVVIPPDLPGLLAELADGLDGALALVTGRSLQQIDGFFAPHTFAAGAQHGAELRQSGEAATAGVADPVFDAVRDGVIGLAGEYPGVRVEDKGASIAVHYRQAPEAERPLRLGLTALLGGKSGIELLPAKMAFDIKRRGLTKGTALEQLMAQPPFAGRVPIFLGDDVTDRFGMAAAQAAGGFAIQVGEAPAAHAEIVEDFSLSSPAAVRAWLRAFAEGIGRPFQGSGRL